MRRFSIRDNAVSRAEGLNDLAETFRRAVITGNTLFEQRLHGGSMIQYFGASNVTITLPANAQAGTGFSVDQAGTGRILFAVGSGGSIASRGGNDRTAGQHALMSAYCRSNVDGLSAVWVLSGDGATS